MIALERYEVGDVLQRGERSTVVRALRRADGRRVVLKYPSAQPAAPDEVRRLRLEAEVGARLAERGGLEYLGLLGGGEVLLEMEDFGAQSLDRTLRGGMSLGEWLDLAQRITRNLESLHALGYTHGDVKPGNILVSPEGRVALCDFGNATALQGARRISAVFGTLAYIAPEQTGRTDRVVDHRADLYAFGATLYHLLTGRRPFETDDPLALLHAHLARHPAAPGSLREGVPHIVDAMIARLMAKDPSDRYQTASGLLHDLQRCSRAWAEGAAIADFPLGEQDLPSTLHVPERVYGREEELGTLARVVERMVEGPPVFVFVAGPSGIGKTSLVRELAPVLLERRVNLCAAKFEELRRQEPYSAVYDAVRGLVRQILSEPTDRLEAWRARVAAAVGSNGRLLTEALPELGVLLGEQAELAEVAAGEAQARFARVSEAFIMALGTPEAPLVLFLDDLQWADDASLRLLESLAALKSTNLLVIGAWRDNEVVAGHPLLLSVGAITEATSVTRIALGPLTPGASLAMLQAALRRDDPPVGALAALLHRLTQGNPFFLKQLLGVLHREGLLVVDGVERRWTWNLEAIAARGFTDNVIDLMVAELRRLSPEAQGALAIASVIGARFDRAALAALLGCQPEEADELLELAVAREFVRPQPEAFGTFRFAHDRVQEAAYELLPSERRPDVHLALGRRMAQDPGANNFVLAGHLNAGRAQMGASERSGLADLNLRAAREAQAANAWSAATLHFDVAAELLGDEAWTLDYERWLLLWSGRARVAFVSGDEQRLASALEEVRAHARSLLDASGVYRLHLLWLMSRNRLVEAIAAARALAGELGFPLPAKTSQAGVILGLLRTRWRMRRQDAATLIALPPMTDPRALAAIDVYASIMTSTFFAEPHLFPVLVYETLRVTLQYGMAAESPAAVGYYGMLTMLALGNPREADRWLEVGKRMVEATGAGHRRHRVLLADGIFVSPWVRPLPEAVRVLRESHRCAVEAGDTEYACSAMSTSCFYELFVGRPLDELELKLMEHLAVIRREHILHGVDDVRRQLQFVRNLRVRQPDPLRMVGPGYDDAEDLRVTTAAGDANAISAIAWYQGMLGLFYRDLDRARRSGAICMGALTAHRGTFLAPHIQFLDAMASLQDGQLSGTRAASSAIRRLSVSAPGAFAPLADLIDAERARLRGRHTEAPPLYESALSGALTAGMTQYAAYAAELFGRYWLGRGMIRMGHQTVAYARQLYRSWGAAGKVAQLDEEFGVFVLDVPGGASSDGATTGSTRTEDSGGSFDVDAAVRASRAIALERTLAGVVRRVLTAMVEDAGAQRAVLALRDNLGSLRVAAECRADAEPTVVDIPLDQYPDVPERIVRLAFRSRAPVVVRDALASPEFANDPYVKRAGCRSVVAAPIVQSGEAIGVICLENNLAAGAFAPGRLDLTTMLAAQAAVSITNAGLYETLERRVAERTEQLEVRNRFIRQTFGRYLSNEVVDSLLETPAGLDLGGARRRVTVVMSDLRGFSALAERLTPEQVIQLLNNYLSEMTEVILAHRGTIDEFIGDGILIVFGAPLGRRDDAERAVACALAMQRAITRVNEWNRTHGLPEVEMGVGVNTGDVVVGNIGSQKRAKYSVVGSQVNLASRVESCTVGGQVLISAATLAAVSAPLRIDGDMIVKAKGAGENLQLYDVGAIGGAYAVELDRVPETFITLRSPAPVSYWELVGKSAVGEARIGWITHVSARGARMRLDPAPPQLTDLRMRFVDAPGEDAYAKIIDATGELSTARFTSLDAAAEAYLASLGAQSQA